MYVYLAMQSSDLELKDSSDSDFISAAAKSRLRKTAFSFQKNKKNKVFPFIGVQVFAVQPEKENRQRTRFYLLDAA